MLRRKSENLELVAFALASSWQVKSQRTDDMTHFHLFIVHHRFTAFPYA